MKRKGEALRIIERQRIGEEMICAGFDQPFGAGEKTATPRIVSSCDGIDL